MIGITMRQLLAVLSMTLLFFSANSYARDDLGDYSIQQALASETAKSKLGNEIQFFFGGQEHSEVVDKKGVIKTNKKTNAFNKSDQEACEWVFLSAMIALKKSALNNGANAIINIKSNYKNNLTSNEKTFQCGAGTFVAGVALVGEMVTIK
jgi:hypothetical protein